MSSMASVVMTLSLLGASPDWTAAFPPAAISSHAGEGTAAVLVAAAGDPSPDRDAAAGAVIAALRAGGRLKLVMDGAAIGSIDGLSDAQVVQKCQALPVQRVVVVRAFPGAVDAPPNAVVTFYDKQGAATASVAASPALPAAAHQAPAPVTAAAPAPAPAPAPVMDEWTARRLYNERAIRMESMTATNAQGYVVATESLGRQGKQVLSTEDLLIRVGRKDLARDLAGRETLRGTLMVSGILGAMAGVAMAPFAALASCTAKSSTTLQCVRRDYTWLTVSGVVAGSGLTLWIAGYLVPTTLSPASVRQLADDYNDKLMRDLGLRSDAGAGAGASGGSLQIALSPTGLTLSGTF